jgi:hypothetical protein
MLSPVMNPESAKSTPEKQEKPKDIDKSNTIFNHHDL